MTRVSTRQAGAQRGLVRRPVWAMAAIVVGALVIGGCESDSEDESIGTDPGSTPDAGPIEGRPDAVVERALTEVVVTGTVEVNHTIEVTTTLRLVATAKYNDSTEEVVTDQADWASEDPAIAPIVNYGEYRGRVTGAAVGATTITATYEGQIGRYPITVEPPPVVSIRVIPWEVDAPIGTPLTFLAEGTYADDTKEYITEQVEWSSSNPAVISISNEPDSKGAAMVEGNGVTDVTATLGEISKTVTLEIMCPYPSTGTLLALEEIMPAVSWEGAHDAEGTRLDYKLHNAHCARDVSGTQVIAFIIGAEWCTACDQYFRELGPQASAIVEAGAEIVWLILETAEYEPADNRFALHHVNELIGPVSGIRAGNAETLPSPDIFPSAPSVSTLPAAFVVRTRDMVIIADQAEYPAGMLPYAEIAADPDGDWAGTPPFEPSCELADEEPTEPNNTPAEASVIEPGSFDGGLCTEGPDFFRIAIDGRWRLSLEFIHAEGDLDVHVWDEEADGPLVIDGVVVGSETSDDNESFEHAGPALVRVLGYQGASTIYRLNLEAL